MTQTVVGVFDTPEAARSAEETLISRGIDESALHLTAQDHAVAGTTGTGRTHRGGTMAGIRNFFAELFGTEHSEERDHYSEALRRGGVMLAVDVPDDVDIEPVREALVRAGAVDIDERAEMWRQQGWTGYQEQAEPYSPDEIARERQTVMPVIQEEIEVGKREVDKGSVRVYSRTTEKPVHESVNLREEHATVERRPADRPATAADLEGLGDKTIEVREMAEKAVVNKTARVVEEVVVGKESSQRTETIDDTVRRTDVDVERDTAANDRSAGARAFEDYEQDYRQDFQSRYANQGGSWDDYAPAYRYGHSLASDNRYQGRDWSAIESDARRDWESRNPNSKWERAKDAVRHGWERMTGQSGSASTSQYSGSTTGKTGRSGRMTGGTGTTGATGTTGGTGAMSAYDDYEPYYRQDFQSRFASQGGSWDDYAPAYRYGHSLASDTRYRGRDWSAIESDARRDWESRYPNSSWERFKMAIRNGWERVTGQR